MASAPPPMKSSSPSCCGRVPGHRQQHAEADARRDQRRAAIGDQRQRHALGRQQTHRDAHVDHRLHAEEHGEPGAGEPDEGVALAHEAEQRADDDGQVERDDERDEQDAEFLGGDGDDEVGMGVGQRPFDLPLPTPTPKKPPSWMALVA